MSYEIRKTEYIEGIDISGEVIVMPLELPMYEGSTSSLCSQALNDLGSFLRHQANCELIEDNFDIDNDPVMLDRWSSERGMLSAKLVAVFMALAGCAENLGIDIMQEIWDAPWEV